MNRMTGLTGNRVARAHSRVLSIVSGKGGVGKSVIAYGLAERLMHLSQRVILVDADVHCGNLHVLANLSIGYGLHEYLSGALTLTEAVSQDTCGIDLLPSLPGHFLERDAKLSDIRELVSRLRHDAGTYDFIIIDQGSGISEVQLGLIGESDEALMVALPELTSISDVYGLYKRIHASGSPVCCRLLVNRARSAEEGEFIRAKFGALSEKFIGSPPLWAGFIPEDETVRQSVARQKPVVETSKQSPVLQALESLAGSLVIPPRGELFLKSQSVNENKNTADIRG